LKLRITVDNKTYEVDVEVAEDDRAAPGGYAYYAPRAAATVAPAAPGVPGQAAAAGAPAPSAGPVDEQKVCRSPVAGVIVRVNTQVGQQIQSNDVLLVLEAMKMETNVTSPVAGKVKTINANVGDPVQVGQVLVEFE
jgi:methylmalonyl-CoA carboxyltransferase small subunit